MEPAGGESTSDGQRRLAAAIVASVALLCVLPLGFVGIMLATAGSDPQSRPEPGRAAVASPAPADPACTWASPDYPEFQRDAGTPPARIAWIGTVTMTITTNLGVVEVVMDRAKTPCTVASFAHLAARDFYAGTGCHRLTTSGIFVLQCGDPSGNGEGGPGYRYADENLPTVNPAMYQRAAVAMANRGANANGSLFFFVYRTCAVPARYTPFGVVTKGMDIVERVAAGGVGTPKDARYPTDGQPKIALTLLSVRVS
jgi:peptidyl-prolyl cis-trans isomerase B (cyclophilin B)